MPTITPTANGFVGPESLINVPKNPIEKVVFFVDDVLFRGFWNTGQQLFSNALFLSGN